MADNTAILFVSDHGDMLGEHGLWFKMNFFEHSARVPLMLCAPGLAPGRVKTPVSTLDVLPTLAELCGVDLGPSAAWTDGVSLLRTARDGTRAPVPIEYAAEASIAPMVALRAGALKFTRCPADADQLFDLDADPHELNNLAAQPEHAEDAARLAALVAERWDLSAFEAGVRESQARRLVTYEALRNGAYYPWDHQPLQKASERYMRNHMDLNVLESDKRFPR